MWRSFFRQTTSRPFTRRFASEAPKETPKEAPKTETKAAEEPKKEIPKVEEPVVKTRKEIRYGEVKRALLRPTRLTKLFNWSALIAGVASIAYYIYDSENTPARKLGAALNMLNHPDQNLRKEGFELLNESVFATKRLFSGAVGIPVPNNDLSSEQVIVALLGNVNQPDNLSLPALAWLLKLANQEEFQDKVAANIQKVDPKFDALLTALAPVKSSAAPAPVKAEKSAEVAEGTPSENAAPVEETPHSAAPVAQSFDYSALNQSRRWLPAAHVLLSLKDKSGFNASPKFINAINYLAGSSDPVAVSVAAQLLTLVPEDHRGALDSNAVALITRIRGDTTGVKLNEKINTVAEGVILDAHKSQLGVATPPRATIPSIFAFSVLGAIWGRVMWSVTSRTNMHYRQVVADADPVLAKQHRAKFLNSRKVGRAMFILMTLDYLGSLFLSSSDRPSYQAVADYLDPIPTTVAIPVAHMGLFTLGTLYVIRRHHFVVVPMAAAAIYNHYDYLKQYDVTNALVEEMGRQWYEATDAPRKEVSRLVKKASELI